MRKRTLWAFLVAFLALGLALAPATPTAAWQGGVTLTIDRGQGANYAISDPLTINFTLPSPGNIRLTSITATGSRLVAEGYSSGTSGTIRTVVGPPEGRHTLRLELYQGNQLTAWGETYFNATPTGQPTQSIGCNSSVNGQLNSATDQDRWTFSANAGNQVSISINAPTPVLLTLQAPNGVVIATGTGNIGNTVLTQDGTYSIIVGGGGQFGAQMVISYQLNLSCQQGPPPPPPGNVTYQAGWNLVGGPTNTTFPVQLYRWDPNAGSYQTVAPNTPVQAGQGYWAYFTSPTSVNLVGVSQTSVVVIAPALQWVMVANPSSSASAVVTGADAVFTYDPAAGQYSSSNTLRPGQGAWAIKYQGGSITISTQ